MDETAPAPTTGKQLAVGVGGVSGLFLGIYLGAFWILTPATAEPVTPPPGTGETTLGLLFVAALLVVTAGMLAAFRFGFEWVVRYLILGITGLISFLVLVEVAPAPFEHGIGILVPVGGAILLVVAVATYPEWWVIDLAGVFVGVGAVVLFGITFGLRTILLLLVLLAIYDFISVYKTRHMLSLAEGALAWRLPVVLFVPTHRGFSLRDDTTMDIDSGVTGVIVIGLGDAIIPGMLVTGAVVSSPAPTFDLAGFIWSVPAIGAILGILLGVVVLFYGTSRDHAHPGLPFLSSGAIIGYLVASVAVGIDPLVALTLG